jgi:hypothetical protein
VVVAQRPPRVVAAVARAMYNRLTPVRRVLLMFAIVLSVISGFSYSNNPGRGVSVNFNLLPAVLILLFLLVMELADRVGLKRDLEIARDIQRMLLPEKPPAIAGIDIAFSTKAANTVAGDYYDAFPRPGTDTRLLLIVADVAGKGIPAGLLMAAIQTGFHTLAADPGTLVELAQRLNRAMYARSGGGRHLITAFLAELDTSTRSLTWVNAGQNPPILLRSGGALEYSSLERISTSFESTLVRAQYFVVAFHQAPGGGARAGLHQHLLHGFLVGAPLLAVAPVFVGELPGFVADGLALLEAAELLLARDVDPELRQDDPEVL